MQHSYFKKTILLRIAHSGSLPIAWLRLLEAREIFARGWKSSFDRWEPISVERGMRPNTWQAPPNAWQAPPNVWENSPNHWQTPPNAWENSPNHWETPPNAWETSPNHWENSPNAWETPPNHWENDGG